MNQPIAGAAEGAMESDVTPEWSDNRLATAFANAHDYLDELQRATAEAVIGAADVRPGQTVLDIGCGSGIPALTLAERVGPAGRVVATDPSPVFVAAVAANAAARGLTNLVAERASVLGLRHPAGAFDAATCHFAAMFFPDLRAGFSKIRELLRSGGRAGIVVWGNPAENTMFGAFWGAAGPYLPPDPSPDPPGRPIDTPNPMRFAEPGTLGAVMRDAGFREVREESPVVDLEWSGSAERMLAFWLELTGIPERLSSEQLAGLRRDVLGGYEAFRVGDRFRFPVRIVVGSGSA